VDEKKGGGVGGGVTYAVEGDYWLDGCGDNALQKCTRIVSHLRLFIYAQLVSNALREVQLTSYQLRSITR
jgi:hypothetical protein